MSEVNRRITGSPIALRSLAYRFNIPVVINDPLPGRSVISQPDPQAADAAIETDSLAARPATTPDSNLSRAPYRPTAI